MVKQYQSQNSNNAETARSDETRDGERSLKQCDDSKYSFL